MWKNLKKIFNRLSDLAPLVLVLWLLYAWAPVVWKHVGMQGRSVELSPVVSFQGERIETAKLEKPLILVFWATWCTPCTVELKRIQRLIDQGSIPAESVLAVTAETDTDLVRLKVKERGYSFRIAHDPHRELFDRFDVSATPTIVVLVEEDRIDWISAGLSPTLEWRLTRYAYSQK